MTHLVIQFSGGKDSLAVLHLLKEATSEVEVEVHYGNTGAQLPEMTDFVRRTCKALKYRLLEVKPKEDINQFQKFNGLPADVVPSWNMQLVSWTEKKTQLIQPTHYCCLQMLWFPLAEAAIDSGAKHIVRGSKLSDSQISVPPNTVDENGIRYHYPVWGWDDNQVLEFLKSIDAELPPYVDKISQGPDCWFCTGYTNHEGAKQQYQYIKDNYPDLWPELQKRIATVKTELDKELRRYRKAIKGI